MGQDGVHEGHTCSAVQNAVQTVQCSAVQCSAVQCSAVQYSAVQCCAVQYSIVHEGHTEATQHRVDQGYHLRREGGRLEKFNRET